MTVKVSPKFQVVIPRKVRESLGLRAGELLQVFELDGRIELVRQRPIREYRGLLRSRRGRFERERGERV